MIIQRVVTQAILAVARHPYLQKLASVWVVSFIAASGGIIARKLHRDPEQVKPPYAERRRQWNGKLPRP